MTSVRHLLLVSLTISLAALPAAAELGFYGWGPRVGFADNPDQFVVGIHQDFGEFVRNLRFQPNIEVGFGDEVTVISGTIPVHYRFTGLGSTTPYVGGGLLLAWIDRDLTARQQRQGKDSSDFQINPVLVGGAEWEVGERSDILVELHLAGGDAFDLKLVVGWVIRAR